MFGRVSNEAERACETLAVALSESLMHLTETLYPVNRGSTTD